MEKSNKSKITIPSKLKVSVFTLTQFKTNSYIQTYHTHKFH